MSILNRCISDTVERINILYDHFVIVFSSGNGIGINNTFEINFDGLVNIINTKLIKTEISDDYIMLFFEGNHTISINMTEEGYSCPEALFLYLKKEDEHMFWTIHDLQA